MDSESDYWTSHHREMLIEGSEILERTEQSIERSNQISIETESIGTEVISELYGQREALLRTKSRLEEADEQITSVRQILTKIGYNTISNKIILILIIIIEVAILIALSYYKFFK